MSDCFLSIRRWTADTPTESAPSSSFSGLYVTRGSFDIDGRSVQQGEGVPLPTSARAIATGPDASGICFALCGERPVWDESYLGLEPVSLKTRDVLLRLDQVSFPPGAVAYRHVHAGSGFRYLTVGELEVASDHQIETAVPGYSWFEPAQSPVRATASLDHPITSFVRFMVLPVAFQGRPSIQILDPSEAAMPRLQQTHRHFEQILSVA